MARKKLSRSDPVVFGWWKPDFPIDWRRTRSGLFKRPRNIPIVSPTLNYGDKRKHKVGVVHSVNNIPVVCKKGLHLAVSPAAANSYRGTKVFYYVAVWGQMDYGVDKHCGQHRMYLAKVALRRGKNSKHVLKLLSKRKQTALRKWFDDNMRRKPPTKRKGK